MLYDIEQDNDLKSAIREFTHFGNTPSGGCAQIKLSKIDIGTRNR
jgi:hypothetical protein